MAEVRSDSRICIQDPTGTIKTVILEEDFERFGYKEKGWKQVDYDWTKDRVVQQPIDVSQEMSLEKLGKK